MSEPAIKQRVLTKVRRQFLHKRPPDDDDAGQYANLLATPEQLNEDTVRLLEPAIGLVETNRTVYAGAQFLNSFYKVNTIKVDQLSQSKTVTLGLQKNDIEKLPWEYCAKRLESYGNLELAAWAERIKTYKENYPQAMTTFLNKFNSNNPAISAAIAAGRAQAALACRELEGKYAYKVTMYASKDSMLPISITYGEDLLKDIGHDVDGFIGWAKENGVPKLFGGNAQFHLDLSKNYLTRSNFKQAFFQEGSEYETLLHTKDGNKKDIKIKICLALDPTPEGYFVFVYIVRTDNTHKNEELTLKDKNDHKEISEHKHIKKESSESQESTSVEESLQEKQVVSDSD